MITSNDIMTSINKIIVAEFPNYTVYVQRCPKDFVRPSFLLEYIRSSWRDVNHSTVEKTVYFTITCFTSIDRYYRLDPDELIELQEKVIQLFSNGYISVADRAIKVQSSAGGIDLDRAYVDLQLEYYDDRTNANDITPLMKSVITNLQEG